MRLLATAPLLPRAAVGQLRCAQQDAMDAEAAEEKKPAIAAVAEAAA